VVTSSLKTTRESEMVRRKRYAVILSDDEVREIRKQYKAGVPTREIAKSMGISHGHTWKIVTRLRRKDVK